MILIKSKSDTRRVFGADCAYCKKMIFFDEELFWMKSTKDIDDLIFAHPECRKEHDGQPDILTEGC